MNHIQSQFQSEADLDFMMEYRNHKSTFTPQGKSTVDKTYDKEVNMQ